MKNIFVIMSFMFGLSAFADIDQIVNLEITRAIVSSRDMKVAYKCDAVDTSLQNKVEIFLAETGLNPTQINVKASVTRTKNFTGRGINFKYLDVCNLHIRLTADQYKLTIKDSEIRHKGDGSDEACEAEKSEYSSKVGYLYSEYNTGGRGCRLNNIISINKI